MAGPLHITQSTLHKVMHRRDRGQIAISFLALMVFVLMLVRMTINLGQMSQVRVETSNAADAGALAAASWVASGQNEAAAISQKMWDVIGMTQALYLVPFCPDLPPPAPAPHRAYANALLQSLAYDPSLIMGPPAPDQVGPMTYFRDVADAAMVSGWVLGGREFLTAAINNMMIRFNLGPVASGGDFGWDEELAGNLPQDIRKHQRDIYDYKVAGFQVDGDSVSDLDWVTPRDGADEEAPDLTPKYKHHPKYHIEGYPTPPKLQMGDLSMRYWQYAEERDQVIVDDPGERFILSFEGVGVRNVWPSPAAPVVSLRDVELPQNPLAVDAHGRKGWDLDREELEKAIPKPDELTIDVCEDPVSGEPLSGRRILVQRDTAVVHEAIPAGIENGAGTLLVQVSHEVEKPSGGEILGFPLWGTRFEPVASEARAEITPATVHTNPTVLNADARLTSTR